MKKSLAMIALACLFASCQWSLPAEPPSSVTNPAVIATFHKAKNGDGDALYAISEMYRSGSNGFPVKGMLADMLLIDASVAQPPSGEACYERYLEEHWDGRSESAEYFLRKSAARGCPRAIQTLNAREEQQRDTERSHRQFLEEHLRSKGLL